MKLPRHALTQKRDLGRRGKAGFTLVEVIVASAVGLLAAGGAMTFSYFVAGSFSGITTQCVLNRQAGYTIELIQSRTRLATTLSNDAAGNVLTMGFDDNPKVDSDGDGTPYNDRNHFEQFKFLGVNTTNSAACASNSLVYIPNTAAAEVRVLIARGARNLPGRKIFAVTNSSCAIIRFGIADYYTRDNYQAIDIQGTAIALNRPATTNFVSILP
jgi:prepilin-type N-terminal cleavage/methylation domain-containing protein